MTILFILLYYNSIYNSFSQEDSLTALLPEVLRYDFPVVERKISGFAAALGHAPAGNEKYAKEMALETICTLLEAGDAPKGLRNLGVREADLPDLAARALKDVCVLTSPRQTDEEDLLGILQRSF